ncbi:uncharacterized protein LOC142634621 [Castanea sativa]|uniref:uncharacterized protein LOC142634621 n=1 Tax=Castanea sativa TaxID=21020 RepID=UPI003F650FBD
MQIFPVVLRRFWNEWEIQALVLISFIIQIILTVMGNRRKYLTGDKLSFILWFAYLSLDWFAAFSLSVLSKNAGNFEDPKFSIKAFWAQFFLLYLGGPDTITAYSMEDNELWRRKFLMLGFQVIIAFYISLKASNQTLLSKLAFPIFIAGIIKIGERIWVLRSASSEKFKASMLHRPDPGPNYARYMEEYCSKKDEGFEVTSGRFMEAPVLADLSFTAPKNVMITDGATLQDAYIFFMTFKQLFADLILSVQDKVNSQSFFKSASCDEAFKVIEVELGFMYDVFYTKAFKVYSVTGCIFRLISFSCTISVLCIFSIMEKPAYSRANVIITYVLLGGATILEIYAVLLLIISDWTKLWLSKHKNAMVDLLYGGISLFDSIPLFGNKRWSQTMGQYNLIEFCLKVRPAKCSFLQKVLCINEWFEKHRYQDSVDVSMSLKELIFQQLVEKSRSAPDDLKDCKDLCASRGDRVLSDPRYLNEISKENLKTLKDSVEVEFDQSILLWHIATNLCYNYDQNTTQNPDSSPNCEASKLLSDYMLYLLVMLPVMLPNGIEQIRFQDTCAEASEFFEERNSISDVKQACMIIHQVSTEIPPSEVKGDRSKSVLFDGCRLAKSLQSLGIERKWELISHVWVEMLCYAASKCRWNHHAQQLTHGGELLTHVWLLMAHLGITEQFQISKGHARARLIVH